MTALVLRWIQPPPPIVTRWRGPSGYPSAQQYQYPTALAAIVGPPGPQGPPGASAQVEAVADIDMVAGTPVYLSRSTGRFYPAYAAWKPASFVTGLLQADVLAGFIGTSAIGLLTLPDWTAIAGVASLTHGHFYFLGETGGIVSTAPVSPNNLEQIGYAADAQTLVISPSTPIQQ